MEREINVVCMKDDMAIGSIPAVPRIPLDDYLDKLTFPREKGNDAIRAYRIRGFLRSKLNGISLKKLSKTSDIRYKNIQNWVCNSKRDVGIPLSELMRIAVVLGISRSVLFTKIEYLGGTNTKRYKLPKCMSPKLAYLLGYMMGDGHLANPSDTISNGSMYNAEIRITTNEKHHLEYLQKVFLDLFGYSPPLYKEKEFYRLVGRSKVIHRFLNMVCGIPTGNKKDTVVVPSIVRTDPVMSDYFLSGFFDADGSVQKSKNRIIGIRIKQHSRSVLEECKNILKKRGFQNPAVYRDDGLRKGKVTIGNVLVMQNQADVQRFINSFFSLKIQDRVVDL